MKPSSTTRLAPLLLATVWLIACDPRQSPGFKGEAKRQEERITRETEEAIKNSSELQELDRICTQVIPRPDGFVPVNKFRTFHGPPLLGYGYHSSVEYPIVKRFYVNYFSQHAWQLTTEKDGGWGPSRMEFLKDDYKVAISESGYKGEGINYFVECVKLQ